MGLALLFARVLLATVFAAAGVAKLVDRAGARRALADFGVPRPAVRAGSLLLPLTELACAVLLLPVTTTYAAGVAALLLLLLFVAAVGVNLARGRRPACHCFGQLAAKPIGSLTLVRNLLLAGVAGFFVFAGRDRVGFDLFGWAGQRVESAGGIGGGSMLAWVGVVLGAASLAVSIVVLVLLVQLVAQNGRLLVRLEGLEGRLAFAPPPSSHAEAGLPVGAPAPEFALDDLEGNALTLAQLRESGKPVLLAFLDPACGPCKALFPDVARWQRELADRVTVVVVSRGALRANRAKADALGLAPVVVQQGSEIAHPYGVYFTPSIVLVEADGRIGSAVAQGAEDVRALVARLFGLAAPQAALSEASAS
jgi:peroxiredoxin